MFGCDGSSGVAGRVAGDRYPTAYMAALDSVRRDKIQLMAPLVWVHDRWTTSIADSYRFLLHIRTPHVDSDYRRWICCNDSAGS